MAELEASWAGMLQARSHWCIVRYRELGLAMTPTLLPPWDPQWAATAWCGVQGSQHPAGSRKVSLHPCCNPRDPVVMGTFCQAYCRHCFWCSTSGSLGVWVWTCLPYVPAFRAQRVGNFVFCLLQIGNLAPRSQSELKPRAVNCNWWNTHELCWLLACIAQLRAVSDMGAQPLTGQTGDSLMSGSSLLICLHASLINSLGSAVRGTSTQIPGETLYKGEHPNPSRKKTNWK